MGFPPAAGVFHAVLSLAAPAALGTAVLLHPAVGVAHCSSKWLCICGVVFAATIAIAAEMFSPHLGLAHPDEHPAS